jgi:hypothetical protein
VGQRVAHVYRQYTREQAHLYKLWHTTAVGGKRKIEKPPSYVCIYPAKQKKRRWKMKPIRGSKERKKVIKRYYKEY